MTNSEPNSGFSLLDNGGTTSNKSGTDIVPAHKKNINNKNTMLIKGKTFSSASCELVFLNLN